MINSGPDVKGLLAPFITVIEKRLVTLTQAVQKSLADAGNSSSGPVRFKTGDGVAGIAFEAEMSSTENPIPFVLQTDDLRDQAVKRHHSVGAVENMMLGW